VKRLLSIALAGALCGAGGGVAAQAVVSASAHADLVTCPPGAFDDTEGVVKVLDKTIDKERAHMERFIAAAILNPGDTSVHQRTLTSGVLVRWTVSRSADGNTYDFLLEMAQPSPTPTYVVVSTLSRTDAGVVNGVDTVNKQISYDYDARKQFVPATKRTGHFDATIVHVNDPSQPAPGDKTTLNATFANITVKPTDKHGPRSGSYSHVGEAGIGGSLDFHASIPVPCPGDTAGPVDILVQRRHVDDALGNERTYRRDALVTGGSLAAGEQAIAFKCGTNTFSGTTLLSKTSYLLKKIENVDGSTQSYTELLKGITAPNCNPVFGALVSPNNNTTDWVFAHPVTFPGEW
jgi:hypothetical protein